MLVMCGQLAGVAELADAPDLGSGVQDMQVRPLSPAPSINSLNLFTVGKKLGLFCFIEEFEDFKG